MVLPKTNRSVYKGKEMTTYPGRRYREYEDDNVKEEELFLKRLKKGIQVTRFVPCFSEIMHALDTLKDCEVTIKIREYKIPYKSKRSGSTKETETRYAIYRHK